MKLVSKSVRLSMLFTLSLGLSGMPAALANPQTTGSTQVQEASVRGANLLGTREENRRSGWLLNQNEREIPTFRIQSKSKGRGVLDVLGGRFVDEDRHPSFRKSTFPQ